jgi:3-deoxy-D-manno-octulosonic-acid transferase
MTLQGRQMRTGPLHKAYSIAVTAALPLAVVGLSLTQRGRRRMAERLGGWGSLSDVGWWIHGASVGEVQGLYPLFGAIRRAYGGDKVLLTASSPTGLERGEPIVDYIRLLPLDSPMIIRRALEKCVFKRFILSETELWPNVMHAALSTGVPCHIVNGRISDYTQAWYARLRTLFSPLLGQFSSVSVPDKEQYERFLKLGVPSERLHVTGHTKYDATPRFSGEALRSELRREFFPDIAPDERIVALGSLREGEEVFWFEGLKRAWSAQRKIRVIVAPRHAEKFEHFARLLEKLQVATDRWSRRPADLSCGAQVLLLDTMGVLEKAYAASDLAFVGATLVDIGGHNPFEPVMYGVPVIVGPYTSVIREPVSLLQAEHAIRVVRTSGDIFDVLQELASEPTGLQDVGRAALQVWMRHQGAAQRVLSVIQQSEALS